MPVGVERNFSLKLIERISAVMGCFHQNTAVRRDGNRTALSVYGDKYRPGKVDHVLTEQQTERAVQVLTFKPDSVPGTVKGSGQKAGIG